MTTRREFARFVLVSGIGLAFVTPGRATTERPLTPQWWLELHGDGAIRMLTKRVEMGQGAHTGLRTLVAEELDVDPSSIAIVQVPSDPKYGEILTGGSFTMAGWHERMRQAAAAARHMLVQAAAARWRVPAREITTLDGHLIHERSARRAAFRELVRTAATLPAPAPKRVALKRPDTWRYIGKRVPVVYHTDMVRGAASYGIDIRMPSMCFAVLARAPVLGARLERFDDAACRRVPGFLQTVALAGNNWPTLDHHRESVAVVAQSSWAAQKARAALQVTWEEGAHANTDSPSMLRQLTALCARPGIVTHEQGDVNAARAASRCYLSSEYELPYLAHAPLEPPNATARAVDGRIEVWSGNQRQTRMKDAIVRTLGVSPERVTVHATLIGGSFGRRLEIDYGVEAAQLAVALDRPVQVLWTREDDLRYGLYRSGSVHRLAASLDDNGRLSSFEHRYAAESVLLQQEPDQIDATRGDWTLAAPLAAMIYDVPSMRLEHHLAQPMAPCAWWRGTYWTNVTTVVECFIDEIADASQQDPLAFRLAHLDPVRRREFVINEETRISFTPTRMRAVLAAVAANAGWSAPLPSGRARGLACGIYDSPECHVAVVVEMGLRAGAPVLLSAIIALDVGTAVNPQIVEAQAMGGFVMGASAVLSERITWRAGKVEQSGFHDYRVMRMAECPRIQVIIVPSDAGVCGVGEIVTPAAMAAVSNAVSRLTGQRVRVWPINANQSPRSVSPG